MTLAKRLFRESTLYALQTVFEKGVVFLLIPLYTAYLSAASYGMLQYAYGVGTFLIPLLGVGLETSFWKATADASPPALAASTAIAIQVPTGLVGVLFCYTALSAFTDPATAISASLYLLALVALFPYWAFLLYLRASRRVSHYVLVSVGQTLLLAGLIFISVKMLRVTYTGVIMATLTANAAVGITCFVLLVRHSGLRIDRKAMLPMVKYGIPLALSNVAAQVNGVSDRFFIRHFHSADDLGVYAYGYQFGSLIKIALITPFFLAWNPMRWEIHKSPNGRETFAKIYSILLRLVPGATLLVIAGSLVLGVVSARNDEYLRGLAVTLCVGVSYAFYALYYFNAMGMLFTGKTTLISGIVLASAITNLCANALLIPPFGIAGAAAATLIAFVVLYILGSVFCERLYPFRQSIALEVLTTALLIAFGIASLAIVMQSRLSLIVYSAVLLTFGSVWVAIGLASNWRMLATQLFAKPTVVAAASVDEAVVG